MQRTRRFGEDSERERAKAEKRCVLSNEHVDEPAKQGSDRALLFLFLLFHLVSSSSSSSSSSSLPPSPPPPLWLRLTFRPATDLRCQLRGPLSLPP